MSIFGISPIELLLILIMGLVVFGPERLPGMGRSLGRMVARVLAWQYTSPEAQLINQLRRDLEQEINDIRDEMIRARDSLDVRGEIEETIRETEQSLRAAEQALRAKEQNLQQEAAQQLIRPPEQAPVAAGASVVAAPAPIEIVSPSGETLATVEPLPTSDSALELLTLPAESPVAALDADFPRPPIIGPAFQAELDADFPRPPIIGPALQAELDADFPRPPVIGPALQAELDADFPRPPVIGATPQVEFVEALVAEVAPVAEQEMAVAELVVATPAPTLEFAAAEPHTTNGAEPHNEPASVAKAQPSDFDLLVMQIQALAHDVATLREQLRRNGLLEADWHANSPLLAQEQPAEEVGTPG